MFKNFFLMDGLTTRKGMYTARSGTEGRGSLLEELHCPNLLGIVLGLFVGRGVRIWSKIGSFLFFAGGFGT